MKILDVALTIKLEKSSDWCVVSFSAAQRPVERLMAVMEIIKYQLGPKFRDGRSGTDLNNRTTYYTYTKISSSQEVIRLLRETNVITD